MAVNDDERSPGHRVAKQLRLARGVSIDSTEAYYLKKAEELASFVSFRNEASAAALVLKGLLAGKSRWMGVFHISKGAHTAS